MKLIKLLIESFILVSLISASSVSFGVTIQYLSATDIFNNMAPLGYSVISNGCKYAETTCPANNPASPPADCPGAQINSLSLNNKNITVHDETFSFQNTNISPSGKTPYVLNNEQAISFNASNKTIIKNISSVICPSISNGVISGTETIETSLPVIECKNTSLTINMSYTLPHNFVGTMGCTYGPGKTACNAGDVISTSGTTPPTFDCNWTQSS